MNPLNSKEIILTKLGYIEEYLGKLEPLLSLPTEQLLVDDLRLPVIERYLQLMIDTAIDINTLIIQVENLQASEDYQGTFAIMASSKVLPHELAFAMAPSVGLRNLLVHQYEKIDKKMMVNDAKRDIGQYRQYVKYVFEYTGRISQKS